MSDMNETEDMGRYLVFYTDLIIQDGQPHETEKQLFAARLETTCRNHGQDFKEHNAFIKGRGFLVAVPVSVVLWGFFRRMTYRS